MMEIIIGIIFIIWCAFCNRVRGSQAFGLVSSTTIGRLLASFGIASATMLISYPFFTSNVFFFCTSLFLFTALDAWTIPAWDAYWSAELGSDKNHSKIWGLAYMTLRMALIIPAPVILAVGMDKPWQSLYATLFLLMGLPYIFWGAFLPRFFNSLRDSAILFSEFTVGAIIGIMFLLVIWG